MKRIIILTALFCLFVQNSAFSQIDGRGNTYFQVGGGPNSYIRGIPESATHSGKQLEFSLSRQIVNPISFRMQASYVKTANIDGLDATNFYGHFDVMWNVLNTFAGVTPNRKCSLNVFTGLGIVRSQGDNGESADNDFCMATGVMYEYQIDKVVSGFAEAKTYLHPSYFDNNEKITFMPSASVGLRFLLNGSCYHQPLIDRMPISTSDWYINFAVLGLNSLNYSGVGSIRDRLQLLSSAAEFGVGKNLSTLWGVRMDISGLQLRSRETITDALSCNPRVENQVYTFYNIHGDLMLNLCNLFVPKPYIHRFSSNIYAGAGLLTRTDYLDNVQFSVNGGLLNRFVVGDHSDVFLDLRYCFVNNRFGHFETPQSRLSVGISTISLGYIYNIGESRTRRTASNR